MTPGILPWMRHPNLMRSFEFEEVEIPTAFPKIIDDRVHVYL